MRFVVASALVAVSSLMVGCRARHHVVHHVQYDPVEVVIAHEHVHSAGCGHYRYRGAWYHVRNHRHHRGCGHTIVAGMWTLKQD